MDRDVKYATLQRTRSEKWMSHFESQPQLLSEQVCVKLSPLNRGALYECVPCGDTLFWHQRSDAWVCPSCEFELTSKKEIELLRKTEKFVKQILKDTKRRSSRWPWARWFNRRG